MTTLKELLDDLNRIPSSHHSQPITVRIQGNLDRANFVNVESSICASSIQIIISGRLTDHPAPVPELRRQR